MRSAVDNRFVKAERQYNPREIDVQIRGFFISSGIAGPSPTGIHRQPDLKAFYSKSHPKNEVENSATMIHHMLDLKQMIQ